MASNIFQQLRQGDGGLFRDESVLRPEFTPDELPGREGEMRELALYLQEAVKGRTPPSTLLIGPPGLGKTTTTNLVLKQLQEVSRKALPLYINCWENSTRFGILNALVLKLGDMMPRRGIAADELVSRLREIGRRQEALPIIVLDEVDRLLAAPGREDQVLYDLARAPEALGLKASVIAITNDHEIALKLDPRVRSSLTNHTLLFKPYTPGQLKAILAERARKAFAPGALDEEAVPLCAAIAGKAGGDARLGIHLLWSAGKLAEREGAKKVGLAHIKAAQASSQAAAATPAMRKMPSLDELDKRLVQLISAAGEGGCDSGALYAQIGADENGQRNLRNRLGRLERAGLIAMQDVEKGAGRSRRWTLKRTDGG